MLPILVSLGPVKIYSFGVCLAIGLFLGLYWWWKMGRDEHFDEIALFDGFFMSLMIFVLAGRLGYVLSHWSEMGTLYRSIAILSYPGVNTVVGIVAVSLFTVLFARYHDWNGWKILDSYSVALSLVLVFGGLGALLNGSNPAWQVNVWGLVWAVISFVVVSRVRKNFRFYAWYKGESSVAQDGLATLLLGELVGVYYLLVGWIGQPLAKIWVIPIEMIIGMVVVLIASYLIYKRVGRREAGLWSKLMGVIRKK